MHCLAVIFRRLGPYHVARLNAAARFFKLSVIEYAAADATYAWETLQGEFSFSRYTITAKTPVGMSAKRHAKARMDSLLSEISPVACALPGWSMTEALMGLNWSARNRVPAVVMTESTAMDHQRVWWKEWTKRQIVQQFSAALAGGSPQADYVKRLGLPSERVFLGYDVVDNDYFASQANRIRAQADEYRRRYSLPIRYFLASARFIKKKNLMRLLEAYADYVAQLRVISGEATEPWHLVLLGDGPLRREVEAKIAQLHLSGLVHLPGFKQYNELPVYYALAKAFIHASTSEQWGLVINEAMACGLPVLVSNRCGCASDLVKEGENGFTFDPFKTEAISNCMTQLSSMSQDELSRLGAASSSIISEWGPERFALGLKSAVECALAQPLRSPPLISRLIAHALIYL